MKVTCRGRLEQEMESSGPCEYLSIKLDLKLDLPLDFSVMQAKNLFFLLQAWVGFSVATERFLTHSDHIYSIFGISG